ncbi:hypothetical protein NDU88_006531 [Pleurodeles waltl]|uniref:Uncharacterized protein n=1 Tax=Pleurodeles waltl TaxID=8319 RepID=A0AAV7QLI1_PLEWA|nr:hypothetical protein NDU88_006531 [Pleurodeles waltl]
MPGADTNNKSELGGRSKNVDVESGVGGARQRSMEDGNDRNGVKEGEFEYPDAAAKEQSRVIIADELTPGKPVIL